MLLKDAASKLNYATDPIVIGAALSREPSRSGRWRSGSTDIVPG